MIIDGKKLAEKIRSKLKKEIAKSGLRPGLASILVGNDAASALYISIKERAAKECGIYFKKYHFRESHQSPVTSHQIINLIKKLNGNKKIHGILVQLPLPKGLDTDKIIHVIDPKKDIDGFHPENIKLIKQWKPRFIAPPHGAILELLKVAITNRESRVTKTKKLNAIIIANSKTFAEPLKWLLEKKDVEIQTIYNNLQLTTNDLQIIKQADIIIVAKGKPKFITTDMIKTGAVVIDVGTNRVQGKLVGDVNFEPVSKKASFITPVPGGVGPMTVAMLLKNVVKASETKSETPNPKSKTNPKA